MTIEQKAKAYDKAIEKIKYVMERGVQLVLNKEDLQYIFPELAESEEEKIRKVLVGFFKSYKEQGTCGAETFNGIPTDKILAWLEKQGEQKEYTFKSLPRLLEMVEPTERARAYCQKLIDSLVKEGYTTDAKIAGECLKQMNREKVALATMDEKQSENFPVLSSSSNIGKDLQVDGFDAELNALLKKYEYLPKDELAECLSFYLGVVQGEQKSKWTEEDEKNILLIVDYLNQLFYSDNRFNLKELNDLRNWLKSLKKRMEE